MILASSVRADVPSEHLPHIVCQLWTPKGIKTVDLYWESAGIAPAFDGESAGWYGQCDEFQAALGEDNGLRLRSPVPEWGSLDTVLAYSDAMKRWTGGPWSGSAYGQIGWMGLPRVGEEKQTISRGNLMGGVAFGVAMGFALEMFLIPLEYLAIMLYRAIDRCSKE